MSMRQTAKMGITALFGSIIVLVLLELFVAIIAPESSRDTMVALVGFIWIFGTALGLWLRGGLLMDLAVISYFQGHDLTWKAKDAPVQNGPVTSPPNQKYVRIIDPRKIPIRMLMVILVVEIVIVGLMFLLPVEMAPALTLVAVMSWLGWLLTAYIMERTDFDWYRWVGIPLFSVVIGAVIKIVVLGSPLSNWLEDKNLAEFVTKRPTLAAYCDCRYENDRLVRKMGERETVKAGMKYRAVRKDAQVELGNKPSVTWVVVNPAIDNDPSKGYDRTTTYLVPKKDLSGTGSSWFRFTSSASAQPAPASALVITTTSGTPSPVAPQAIEEFAGAMEVPTSAADVETGMEILPGQTVRIKAIGSVKAEWDLDFVGPAGHPIYRTADQSMTDTHPFLMNSPIGALVGKVGDGEWFYIGEGTTLSEHEIGAGGNLLLAVNQRQTGFYRRDAGKFLAKITIEQ